MGCHRPQKRAIQHRVEAERQMIELVVGAAEDPSANRRVLAFRVFTDDDEIDLGRRAIGKRRADAFEQFDGSQVHVLIEAAANGNEQSPQ